MSITMTTVILFAVFGVLLFLGVPISISIVASSIVTAMSTLSWDQITFITMQKMNSGVESFSLLAVPLFILAGNIMNNGGIAKRLVNFAQLFVGKIPGSMAQANILGNMLFGALSGSSVAAASAMGGCIAPIEEENGYDPAYSAAANIASAPTGLLIPPTSDSEIGRSSALSTFCRNAAILALAPTLTAPDAAFAFTTAAAGIVANTGACSIVFSTGTTGVSTDVDSCEDCISWAIGRSSISLSYK